MLDGSDLNRRKSRANRRKKADGSMPVAPTVQFCKVATQSGHPPLIITRRTIFLLLIMWVVLAKFTYI